MPKLRRRRRLPGKHYYRPGRQNRRSKRRQLWGRGGKEFFRLICLDQLGSRTKCASTITGKQLSSCYVCMWNNWYTHLNKHWTGHQKYIKAWPDMCVFVSSAPEWGYNSASQIVHPSQTSSPYRDDYRRSGNLLFRSGFIYLFHLYFTRNILSSAIITGTNIGVFLLLVF